MIIEVTDLKEDNEQELYENLIKEFNQYAKSTNSKYKIVKLSNHCELIKPIILGLWNNLGNHEIFYSDYAECFYFYRGIDPEVFKEIKYILENIKSKFKIEVVKNE